MMKNFLIAASIVTLAFAGCKNSGGNSETGSADSTVARVASSQIAYVNIDSLINSYDLYLDLRSEYETKAKKVEADLTSKGRSLERQVMDYQDKAQKGLMTRSQMAETEEKLQQQQQNFMQQREKALQEMGEEEQVMMNRIHYSITDFLREYNSDYRYGMILSTAGGNPVLNADPVLDITSLILKGLNERYATEKAAAKK